MPTTELHCPHCGIIANGTDDRHQPTLFCEECGEQCEWIDPRADGTDDGPLLPEQQAAAELDVGEDDDEPDDDILPEFEDLVDDDDDDDGSTFAGDRYIRPALEQLDDDDIRELVDDIVESLHERRKDHAEPPADDSLWGQPTNTWYEYGGDTERFDTNTWYEYGGDTERFDTTTAPGATEHRITPADAKTQFFAAAADDLTENWSYKRGENVRETQVFGRGPPVRTVMKEGEFTCPECRQHQDFGERIPSQIDAFHLSCGDDECGWELIAEADEFDISISEF